MPSMPAQQSLSARKHVTYMSCQVSQAAAMSQTHCLIMAQKETEKVYVIGERGGIGRRGGEREQRAGREPASLLPQASLPGGQLPAL